MFISRNIFHKNLLITSLHVITCIASNFFQTLYKLDSINEGLECLYHSLRKLATLPPYWDHNHVIEQLETHFGLGLSQLLDFLKKMSFQCHQLFRLEKPRCGWKVQDFSVTLILREINIGECRSSKTAILCYFKASEFC